MVIHEALATFVAHQRWLIYIVITHHGVILEESCHWLRPRIEAYVEGRVVSATSLNLSFEVLSAEVRLRLEASVFGTGPQCTLSVSLLELRQCFGGLHDLLLVKRRIQIIEPLLDDYCVSLVSSRLRNATFLLNIIDLRL